MVDGGTQFLTVGEGSYQYTREKVKMNPYATGLKLEKIWAHI